MFSSASAHVGGPFEPLDDERTPGYYSTVLGGTQPGVRPFKVRARLTIFYSENDNLGFSIQRLPAYRRQ